MIGLPQGGPTAATRSRRCKAAGDSGGGSLTDVAKPPPSPPPREAAAAAIDRIMAEHRASARGKRPKTRGEQAQARSYRRAWLALPGKILGAVAARWLLETIYWGGNPAGVAVIAQWTQLAVCCTGLAASLVTELRTSIEEALYDREGPTFASGVRDVRGDW
jgi:hypothetical protein